MKSIAALVMAMIIAIAGSGLSVASDSSSDSSNEKIIRAFVEAYNEHDVEAMLALASDDIEWLYVTGKSIAMETGNKTQLRKSMIAHFKASPSARSAIADLMVSGNYVTATERAFLKGGTSERFQQALSVYELQGNLIKRVWYYPVQRMN